MKHIWDSYSCPYEVNSSHAEHIVEGPQGDGLSPFNKRLFAGKQLLKGELEKVKYVWIEHCALYQGSILVDFGNLVNICIATALDTHSECSLAPCDCLSRQPNYSTKILQQVPALPTPLFPNLGWWAPRGKQSVGCFFTGKISQYNSVLSKDSAYNDYLQQIRGFCQSFWKWLYVHYKYANLQVRSKNRTGKYPSLF